MLRVRDMSLYGHKGIRKTLFAGSVTLALFLYGIVGINIPFIENPPATLEAQSTSQELRGYAWSDNIGWISFSCLDTASCDTTDYGVVLNSSNTLSGYAWSDNIGWIKFGGLSAFPEGNGTNASNAELDGAALHGWVRACAGTINGDCSSMTNHPDGWDGWISLVGSGISQASDSPGGGSVPVRGGFETGGPYPAFESPSGAAAIFNYGITVNGGEFAGYAWGGDVIGWIDWKPFIDSVDGCTSNCGGGGGGGCQGVCVSEPFAFDLDVPSAVEAQRGDSSQATVTTELLSGFAETVTFSHGTVVGLSNLSFSQSSCNPDCSTVLSFTVDNDATYGQHPVVITAVSTSGVTESKTIYINVPSPDITDDIACSADKAFVLTGQTVTWSVLVNTGGSYTYVWSDATGQIGTGQSIQKSYDTPGLKGVTVTASGAGGATGDCTATVTVNKRPVIEEF